MSSGSGPKPDIVADCHVHFYPDYEWPTFLSRIHKNLGEANRHAVRAAFFTEGNAYDFFNRIRDGRMPDAGAGIEISAKGEKTLCLRFGKVTPPLFLFAGRQIVTHERLEILALVVNDAIPDDMPAMDTVASVLEVGGLPILPWAPGKWTLQRKSAVKSLLSAYRPGQLFLGDTTLRPTLTPEPNLMQWAVSKGFAVLAGSDPLPVKGEERYAGSYGIHLSGSIDDDHPARSICKLLHEASIPIPTVGRRCSPPVVARRIARHEWAKRVSREKVKP